MSPLCMSQFQPNLPKGASKIARVLHVSPQIVVCRREEASFPDLPPRVPSAATHASLHLVTKVLNPGESCKAKRSYIL